MKILILVVLLALCGIAQAATPNPPTLCEGLLPCAPPPVAQGCPIGPMLREGPMVNGQYFYDCGEATQLLAPEPTKTFWHIGGGGTSYGTGMSMCLSPGSFAQDHWRYPEGNVTFANSDQRLILDDTILGDLILAGARLQIQTRNGTVQGNVICGAGASNVELDGECICP